MYVIKIGDERKEEFDTRKEAVKAARRISKRRHNPVRVLRDGGIERLIYKRGSLVEGAYITRDRRRHVSRFS